MIETTTHQHIGSACGGYHCPNCQRESDNPFRCPCGAGEANHVLLSGEALAAKWFATENVSCGDVPIAEYQTDGHPIPSA